LRRVAWLCAPETVLFEQGKQGFGGRGFLDEIERTQSHDSLVGLWLDVAGDDNHLVAQPFPLEGLQHAITIHFRHGEVEKDRSPWPISTCSIPSRPLAA